MERGIAIKERDGNGERKREIFEAWCNEERERKCALYSCVGEKRKRFKEKIKIKINKLYTCI